MDEKHLIDAIQKGDRRAFQQLYAEQQSRVLNTCLGFVPNLQDAEDICQEVFVKVYQNVATFKGEAALSTWIYRITVRECLTFIRRRKRGKRSAFFQSLAGLGSNTEVLGKADFEHPGVLLENKERGAVLFAQINRLPENQRIAFTLHKVEGLAYKEIASIMDISLSAVESLVFRARKNLKKFLYSYYKNKMI